MQLRIVPAFLVLIVSTTLFLSQSQTGNITPSQTPGGIVPAGGGKSMAVPRNSPVPTSKEVIVAVTQQSNPLLKVADQVTQQLLVPVAYEEPAWIFPTDLISQVDSPEVRSRFSPAAIAKLDPRVRIAALGTVSANATLREGQDAMQIAASILRESLSDHSHRGNPGIFKLVSVGGYGYSIVPEQVRGDQGQWVSVLSPLDARISITARDRSLGATLELIAEAVSTASGQRVSAQFQLMGLSTIYDVAKTHVGAENEIARDVLAKTFREMTMPDGRAPIMWWNLEYLVGHETNKDAYRLRFHSVNLTTPENRLDRVYWPKSNEAK